jgi:hypothetical protein
MVNEFNEFSASDSDKDHLDEEGHSEQSPVEQDGMTAGEAEQTEETSKGNSSSGGDFNQIPNKSLAEVLNSIFNLGDHLEVLYEDDKIDDNGTFVAAFNRTLLWADHDGNFNVTDLNGPLSVKKVPSKRRRKKKQKENKRGRREEETKDPKSIMKDVMNKMENEESENETEENVILRVMHEDSENEETSEVTFEIIDDSSEDSMDQEVTSTEEESHEEDDSDEEEITMVMIEEEHHSETDDKFEVSVDDTDAEVEDSEEETEEELDLEEEVAEDTEEELSLEEEAAPETDEVINIEEYEDHYEGDDQPESKEEQAISLVEDEPEKDQAVSLVEESLETSDTVEEEAAETFEEGSDTIEITVPDDSAQEEKRD